MPRIARSLPTALLIGATALSACATPPDQIAAAYTSPTAYAGLGCAQLNAEAARINARLQTATNQQEQAANSDAAMTAVALILFWPAAFAIQGDSQAATIAQLRGDAEAVHAAALARGC